MFENFDKCIEVVLKSEGGYVNHPKDPGGETNFGISKRYYQDVDIKNLTKKCAKQIYYKDYWSKMKLDLIEDINIQLELLDFGINAGTSTAIKKAQQITRVVTDGVNGKLTSFAINNYDRDFVKDYKHSRLIYYEYLADKKPEIYGAFINGWKKRITHTHF